MRVADSTVAQLLTTQLLNDQSSVSTLQSQLSSGQALSQPSDNPAAVVQVLADQSQLSQVNSWQANTSSAQGWLGVSGNTVGAMVTQLQQARTLLLGVQSATTSSAQANATAAQITAISQSLLSMANTTYLGRSVFGGCSPGAQAYNAAGTYVGSGNAPTTQVGAGQHVALSLAGPQVLGTGSTSAFAVLAKISSDLTSGAGTAALSADLGALTTTLATTIQASATLGIASSQVQNASTQLQAQSTNLTVGLNQLQSINVPQVATELQTALNTYQGALAVTSKVVLPSVLSFL